jgi:hypothetical protein
MGRAYCLCEEAAERPSAFARTAILSETMPERGQSQLADPEMAWSPAWKSTIAATNDGLWLQSLGQRIVSAEKQM